MTLCILGSTGSIGKQSLDVARLHGISVAALTAFHNVQLLEQQIRQFHPALAVVVDPAAAKTLQIRVADTNTKVLSGTQGLLEAVQLAQVDMVLNALVGMAGLLPTVTAIRAGKDIALANKETLVAGGDLVMELARQKGVRILPVDSEHSAVFQALQGNEQKDVNRIILTASGGPFFGKSKAELAGVTAAQALRHPNWNMGQKITIDCATMMNKGFEVIEAAHLFGLPEQQIDVVIHRESIVHSMVEYTDHSVMAQMGVADMRIPIQYALTWPRRQPSPAAALDLTDIAKLTFYPPDDQNFPCLSVCRQAIRKGGVTPAAVNAVNEEAVRLFLQDRIGFLEIAEWAQRAYDGFSGAYSDTDDLLRTDADARRMVREYYAGR